jgi:membrane protease YdiL (CAAX protease family)
VANASSALSQQAADYIRDYLDAINRNRMRQRGVINEMSFLVDFDVVTSSQKAKPAVSFGTLIPFILVLMTITGAVYPAIDLTAGERERGTMEALVAAPIPRMRILFAKFIAVLTVAMLTATLNVLGMLATIWAFRLEGLIFESGKFSLISIGQVFALLLLFAAFFSALLLAVTSFARSFKEAQAYLIPLILLSLAPGVVSLAPGLTLSGPISLVPLLNFVLLARDILQSNVATVPALIAILSTLLYAALAVAVASRIFGTDAILYGSQQSVRDSLRRPRQVRDFISPLGALFCLTCLFPANFVAISLISRFAGDEFRLPLLIMAVVMIVFFVFFPLLFAWHQRVRLKTGFALGWPGLVPLLAAILIGLTAWPITVFLLALTQQVVTLFGGAESGEAWQQRLVEGGQSFVVRWRQLPIALILLTHAVIPAVVEEWFFRGFLLQSLRTRSRRVWLPIVLSGLIFGAFHLLTESVIALDRFMPTTLMGIFLAVICVRTGSIWPGVIVHMLNNGTVIALAYYNQELQRQTWFPFQGDTLPWMWLLGLLAICAIAFFTLWRRP